MAVLTIFVFVLWFWLLVTIFADLFRRHDISRWAKTLWVIAVILTSYIGISFTDHSGERHGGAQPQQTQAARDELRRVVGFSVADEIGKLDQFKSAGSITEDEFAGLRARLVQ